MLSHNHSGFLCHVTLISRQNILAVTYKYILCLTHFIFEKVLFSMESLVTTLICPKTNLGRCCIDLFSIIQAFQLLKGEKYMAAIFSLPGRLSQSLDLAALSNSMV